MELDNYYNEIMPERNLHNNRRENHFNKNMHKINRYQIKKKRSKPYEQNLTNEDNNSKEIISVIVEEQPNNNQMIQEPQNEEINEEDKITIKEIMEDMLQTIDINEWKCNVSFTNGVTEKFTVPADPYGAFKKAFGGILVEKKTKDMLHRHPASAQCRTLMENAMFSYLNKRYVNKIVSIGGNPIRNKRKGAIMHCANAIIDGCDELRQEKYKIAGIVDDICYEGFQNCKCIKYTTDTILTSVDSFYYEGVYDTAYNKLINNEAKEIWFTGWVLRSNTAQIPLIEYDNYTESIYDVNNNIITMSVNGNDTPYQHEHLKTADGQYITLESLKNCVKTKHEYKGNSVYLVHQLINRIDYNNGSYILMRIQRTTRDINVITFDDAVKMYKLRSDAVKEEEQPEEIMIGNQVVALNKLNDILESGINDFAVEEAAVESGDQAFIRYQDRVIEINLANRIGKRITSGMVLEHFTVEEYVEAMTFIPKNAAAHNLTTAHQELIKLYSKTDRIPNKKKISAIIRCVVINRGAMNMEYEDFFNKMEVRKYQAEYELNYMNKAIFWRNISEDLNSTISMIVQTMRHKYEGQLELIETCREKFDIVKTWHMEGIS